MTDLAFTLAINGQNYGGWTAIEVTRNLDCLCSSVEIESTDRWPGQPTEWPVQTGDAYVVKAGGATISTGWIDEVEPEIDGTEHKITLRGRGKTGDLVDCSAMNKPGRWANRTLDQIVTDLVSPFGLSVSKSGDMGAPFKAFALQQGEAVKDAIDRLCQQRGIVPFETPDGNLQLAPPGQLSNAGSLSIGESCNVTIGQATHDAKARFSTYVVKGQRQGHDGDHGKAVAQVTGQASDPAVTRYRPLMIISEDQADGPSAADRAQMAATVRAARGQTGRLTVTGSTDTAGALWQANALVDVDAPVLGLEGQLLINVVKFKQSPEGTLSEIHVVRREAYSLGVVKGTSLARLFSRNAGRGQKARKGRKGRRGGKGGASDLQLLSLTGDGGGGGE